MLSKEPLVTEARPMALGRIPLDSELPGVPLRRRLGGCRSHSDFTHAADGNLQKLPFARAKNYQPREAHARKRLAFGRVHERSAIQHHPSTKLTSDGVHRWLFRPRANERCEREQKDSWKQNVNIRVRQNKVPRQPSPKPQQAKANGGPGANVSPQAAKAWNHQNDGEDHRHRPALDSLPDGASADPRRVTDFLSRHRSDSCAYCKTLSLRGAEGCEDSEGPW